MAARLGENRLADDVIGLLDIGNSKTVCLVVAVPRSGGRPDRAPVLGVGVQPTRGLKVIGFGTRSFRNPNTCSTSGL